MRALLVLFLLLSLAASAPDEKKSGKKEVVIPKDWSHDGCDRSVCVAKAFDECGTGHENVHCRLKSVKKCMKHCREAYDEQQHQHLETWKPEDHRECSEAHCMAKAFTICGTSDKMAKCRERYRKHCRKQCLSERMLKALTSKPAPTTKPFVCNDVNCYARSFEKCPRGSKGRKCRKEHVKKCLKSCKTAVTTTKEEATEPPAHLGCDHHTCTAKALLKCGDGWESAQCRGHVYTECRGDNSICLAHAFVVCGHGKENKHCRKRYLAYCKHRCRHPATPKPTTAPNITTTAPHPCGEDICLMKALKFCGQSLDHKRCNKAHFHYCMLDCPPTTVTDAPTTDTTLTFAPTKEATLKGQTTQKPTKSPLVPCSGKACRQAAKIVCGRGIKRKDRRCRHREEVRCIAHCKGEAAARVHARIRSKCSKHGRRYEQCQHDMDKDCAKRAKHDLRKCIRRTGLLLVGKKVLRTCKRHGRRVIRCRSGVCRRKAKRALRRCVRQIAKVMVMLKRKVLFKESGVKISESAMKECKTHARAFLDCKHKPCFVEARQALTKCVADIEKRTKSISPFTDPLMTQMTAEGGGTTAPAGPKHKPCTRKACQAASRVVCGVKNDVESRHCRVTEVLHCLHYCQDKSTTTPAPTTDIASTYTREVTTTTPKVFFTKPPANYSETGVPTFNFFLPETTTRFQDRTPTAKPGKCDHEKLYKQYKACRNDKCREGVAAFMKVCDSHNAGPLKDRKAQLKLALAACKTLECKVSNRFSLQRVSLSLVKHEISRQTLEYKHLKSKLPKLRRQVRQCTTKQCKKVRTVEVVEVLEKIVVAKARRRVLKTLKHAVESEKLTIDVMKAMVKLKQQMVECVTRTCAKRIKGRLFKANKRLSKARRHWQMERRLYKMSHRMLKLVESQARATTELSKCEKLVCRNELKAMLARLTRRVHDLQDRINSLARVAHHSRHRVNKAAMITKFTKLRQKLIVKRAGCRTSRCKRTFTRRIDLYKRMIRRVRSQRASKFIKSRSIVHGLDRSIWDVYHSTLHGFRHDDAMLLGEDLTNESPSCLKKLAALHEKLSKALKANKAKEAKKLEDKITVLDCSHLDDVPKRDHAAASDFDVSRYAKHRRHHEEVTVKPTKKPSCLEQTAELNEKIANGLKMGWSEQKMNLLESKLGELDCDAALLHDYDAHSSDSNKDKGEVEDAHDCLGTKQRLHSRLGAALKSGDKEEAKRLEDKIERLQCNDNVGEAKCRARKRRVEAKTAHLNLQLMNLYNVASLCGGDRACRLKATNHIAKIKDELSTLERVVC